MSDKQGQDRLTRDDLDHIRASVKLVDRISRDVVLTKRGHEYTGVCPFHSETAGSFTVRPDKGFYKCFGCGAGGDVIDFHGRIKGLNYFDAARDLIDFYALADVDPLARQEAIRRDRDAAEARARRTRDEALQRRRRARELWARAIRDLRGTAVEDYLKYRGIDKIGTRSLPFPPTIRMLAGQTYGHGDDGRRFPVMIAAMQRFDPETEESHVVAVHRTWISGDGAGKAAVDTPKKILGGFAGAAIRLAAAAETLAIAEGIETGLSVMQATCMPVWVAGSLGNMGGGGLDAGAKRPHPDRPGQFLPSVIPDPKRPGVILPPVVKRVVILADNDSKDPASARALITRAAARFLQQGRTVEVAWPNDGADFNDMLAGAAS